MNLKNILFSPLLVCLLFVSLGVGARAQLPESVNGWETTAVHPIHAAELAEFAGSDAAIVLEYGFAAGEHREYAKNGATLSVNLWKMKDSSGGYGLYTFYRQPGTASAESQDRVAIGPNRLLIQRGAYVLDAQGAQLTIGDSKLLLAKIPPASKEESVGTFLPAALPEENMVPQSSKFLMGPVAFQRLEKDLPPSQMGFEVGAEAEMAQYQIAGKNVRLILVSYATPQLASKKLRAFQQLPAVANPKDGNGVFLDRKGSLVGVVLGAPSSSAAESLLQGIRHENQVTWSQYVPTRRDNIGQLILNVFLLAGFVLLFALVAGLSFGGIRVLAKKFLPVPVFDRPSQIEIIQLHLSDR